MCHNFRNIHINIVFFIPLLIKEKLQFYKQKKSQKFFQRIDSINISTKNIFFADLLRL